MTISVNSNRIQTPAGGTSQRRAASPHKDVAPRAQLDHIPEDESLFTLIRSAVAALRQGKIWDRGSILNILT